MSPNPQMRPEFINAFESFDKQERIRLFKFACWFVVFGMPAGFLLDLNIIGTMSFHF